MTGKIVKILLSCLCIVILLLGMTACRDQNETKNQFVNGKPSNSLNSKNYASSMDIDNMYQNPYPGTELAKLDKRLTKIGSNGEKTDVEAIPTLTQELIQQIKDKKLKAAIAMQYMDSDWSKTQVKALKEQFAKMGVDVVAVTDAHFEPMKQIQDIESILKIKPDILVSIPVDTVATAPVYQLAADQGVKIVFMNHAALGLRPGKDYASLVAPDDYGNGARGAHLIARKLGGVGKVGIIYYAADFSTTKIRYEAFRDAIRMYPGISIVEAQGISGPDFESEAKDAVSGMLQRHPDINAIWGVWDVPTKGIIEAAKKAGREDLVITTVDLGEDVALDMAKKGLVKGLGAQTVYDAGVTEATVAALAAIGKPVPEFIVMDGITTDRDNLLKVWKRVYHEDPPEELISAFNNTK